MCLTWPAVRYPAPPDGLARSSPLACRTTTCLPLLRETGARLHEVLALIAGGCRRSGNRLRVLVRNKGRLGNETKLLYLTSSTERLLVDHHDESASLATDHQIALSYVAVDFPSTSGAPADRQDLEGQAARGGSQREGLGTSCRDRLADLVPKPAPLSPWEKRAQLRRQFGLDP